MTSENSPGRSTIDAAVETLYGLFARYPLPTNSSYSTQTTISEQDVQGIRSKPLRELAGHDLVKFSMKALTTWGDEDEFRHYLPRMLELVASSPGWIEIPTLFGKLRTGDWRSWPHEEQRAIEAYFATLWESMLRGDIDVSLADLALGASNAGISLAEPVRAWKQAEGMYPSLHLAYLIVLERNELLRSGTLGHRWSSEARQELTALVRSVECRHRLEGAFFQVKDPVQADTVSRAVGILDAMTAGDAQQ